MLEYDRIDVSEGIHVNKTKESRRCTIRNYYYFLEINFRFQPNVCDGCHDLTQKDMSFNGVGFFSIKGNDYRNHFLYMSKAEAINIMKISDLKEKCGTL